MVMDRHKAVVAFLYRLIGRRGLGTLSRQSAQTAFIWSEVRPHQPRLI